MNVYWLLDDDRLVSGSRDSNIIIWNMNNKEENRILKSHDSCITSLCELGDNRSILSGGLDRTIVLWDI